MGTFNGEYYQDFTKSPDYSNKITIEKQVYNKLGKNVEAGINVAVIQSNIDHNKKPAMTIEEYLASIDKKEPIEYVVQSEVER